MYCINIEIENFIFFSEERNSPIREFPLVFYSYRVGHSTSTLEQSTQNFLNFADVNGWFVTSKAHGGFPCWA